jgi:hypothetical protein
VTRRLSGIDSWLCLVASAVSSRARHDVNNFRKHSDSKSPACCLHRAFSPSFLQTFAALYGSGSEIAGAVGTESYDFEQTTFELWTDHLVEEVAIGADRS